MNAVASAVQAAIGIQSRVPVAEYALLPGTSITRLKELRRSPQHYAYSLTHPKQTPPMSLGVAAHTAVLEPERFDTQFAIWGERTDNGNLRPRRGKDWDAFADLHAQKTIITGDEAALVRAIQYAVRTNPVAMPYLEAGDPEVTLQWVMHGRQCKGRVDWLTYLHGDAYIVGLKTARDCRPFVFGSAAAKLGYHLQWGWYFNGFSIIKGGERPKLVEIVVESAPPHAVVVYTIPDDVLLQGEEEFMQLLAILDRCERENEWPGPATVEQVMTLPSWVYQADDDISDLGLVT